MPWEDVKAVFRPETVHMGVMKLDADRCTSCGLCLDNCPLRAWEMDANDIPRLREGYQCFSCFNCMVACPRDAISIADIYHVDDGVYASDPQPLEARIPLEPYDAEGKPDKWNPIERAVFQRRSVRNFKDKPVPEHLIRRVLEAGRFAPSAGNCQPWKFIVVTNKALIDEMNQAILSILSGMYAAYTNDGMVKSLAPMYEASPQPGNWDPRVIRGGIGTLVTHSFPIFLNAPAVVLILCDTRCISGPEINTGICGQNMNLVANSLGIKACWIGFSTVINMVPSLVEKFGFTHPWQISNAMVLGYPRFKQEGVVPRVWRPITWFREAPEAVAEVET